MYILAVGYPLGWIVAIYIFLKTIVFSSTKLNIKIHYNRFFVIMRHTVSTINCFTLEALSSD